MEERIRDLIKTAPHLEPKVENLIKLIKISVAFKDLDLTISPDGKSGEFKIHEAIDWAITELGEMYREIMFLMEKYEDGYKH